MKAFARYHHDAIFLAPTLYMSEVEEDTSLQLCYIWYWEELKKSTTRHIYRRMIQHPDGKKTYVTQILVNCSNELVYLMNWYIDYISSNMP